MSVLDSLIVNLEVNSAALRTGLNDAANQLKTFGDKLSGIDSKLKAFGQMQGVQIGKELVEGLAQFIAKGAEAAAMMGRLAAAAGVPTEAFSRLAYAASLSGLGSEDLAKGLEKFDKALGAAGSGAKDQSALFDALGVSVKDASGNVRSTEAVLGDVADKFAGMENGASKTALAMQLFGKSGAQLIPFLNEGRAGIAALGDEAQKLGLVISGPAAAAAKQFEDNLKKLEAATQGVATRAAADLAPSLSHLTEDLLKSKGGADGLKEASSVLAGAFRVLATAGAEIFALLRIIGVSAAGVTATFVALATDGVDAAREAYQGWNDEVVKIGKQTQEQIRAIWDTAGKGTLDFNANLQPALGSADEILKKFQAGKQAATDYTEAQKALNAVINDYGKKIADIAGGGKDPLAEITQRLSSGDLAKFLKAIGAAADLTREKILALATALQSAAIQKLNIDFRNTENDRQATAEATGANKLTRAGAATDLSAKQSGQDFSNITAGPLAVLAQLTAGFTNFAAALNTWTTETKAAAYEQERVTQLEADSAAYKSHADALVKAGEDASAEQWKKLADGAADAAAKAQALADAHTAAAEAAKKAEDAFKETAQTTEAFRKSMVAITAAGTHASGADLFAEATANLKQDVSNIFKLGLSFDTLGAVGQDVATGIKAVFTGLGQSFANLGNVGAAIAIFAQGFASKLGKLGEVINAAIQGFQQGGIWGAIAAVLVEFITSVKGWTAIMNIGNGQFQMALQDMSKGIGDLLDGLKPLMGAIEQIANAIHGVLSPILSLIGSILKGIAPLFATLGESLKPLGTIVGIIAGVLQNTLAPAFQLMGPVLWAVDEVLMAVQLAFQFLKLGLDVFLDWIKKAVSAGTDHSGQAAVDADNAAIYGPGGTIDQMKQSAQAELDGLSHGTLTGGTDQIDDTTKAGDMGAPDFNTISFPTGATIDFGTATDKATTALQKMTASLTNVPDGFKTALRRFEAQSTAGGLLDATVSALPPTILQVGLPGANGPGHHSGGGGHTTNHNYQIGNVTIQGNLEDLWNGLKKIAAKKHFHATGAPQT